MSLRIPGLTSVDPRCVPLPNGTEVSIRVSRIHEGRTVPQGCAGRVVRTHGDEVDVVVVGVGMLRLQRDEVLPRKEGQLRFARRRAASWEALLPCVVLDAVVGSRAWGLSDEGSDTDRRGVFALPFVWTVTLRDAPTELVSLDGSATYWALRKTVHQALRADPNTLELFFVDGVHATDDIGRWLLDARHAFASRRIHGSFGRYALSQLHKLSQSLRLAEHRSLILDWLRDDEALSLDEAATRLADRTLGHLADRVSAVLQAKTYVKQLTRSLHDQGLIVGVEFRHLRTLVSGTPLDLPRELRPKNAYNLLRLITTAIHWLRTGEAQLRVSALQAPRLLSIKRGEVALADVLAEAEALAHELDDARARSPLPEEPDVATADALLRRAGAELARRHVESAPGPFGRDAPVAPVAAVAEEET